MGIEITVYLDEESIEEIFESYNVKFSKAKRKELQNMFESAEIDIREALEEQFKDEISNLVLEEWESEE